MAINLDISAGDIATVIASFDVIRVERSTTLDTGPFTEITAPTAQAATLTGAAGTFTVTGLTLSLILNNGTQVDVTFTGTNPLTTDQVVAQINAAVGVNIASNVANVLVLTSNLTGTASRLEIIGGAAAPILGFSASQNDFGEDAYITLVPGQTLYSYTDNAGVAGNFYRTRFFNTITNVPSAYSPVFTGAPGTQVQPGNLALCFLDIVDAAGNARPGQQVAFYPVGVPLKVDGFDVGIGAPPLVIETDNSGHAETNLVVGQRLRAVFVGTSLVRDFTVPATAFDLLTVLSTSSDIFDVQQPQLPAAPRRTT